MACESVKHNYTNKYADKGQLLHRSWVTKCDPLSALHCRVANETSLNEMADSVDEEQYVKFVNNVRP